MYQAILHIYENVKSCVINNNCTSNFFPCCNGVKQGVTISTFLFSIFLNGLESFCENRDIVGLETVNADNELQLNVFLKIFCILYADGSVPMDEPPCELHSQPDIFYEYCQYWKLTVNIEKTSRDSPTIISIQWKGTRYCY